MMTLHPMAWLWLGIVLLSAITVFRLACRGGTALARGCRRHWPWRRAPLVPPVELTAPRVNWGTYHIATWRRREQPFPALARLAPPPELTAPLPDWTAQERPTWQRLGQPFPTLAPATVAAPPPPLTSDPVIF